MAEKGWPLYSHSSPNAAVSGPCPNCVDLQHQLRAAQEELLVAKRNAESWQETAQQAQAKAEAAEAQRNEAVIFLGQLMEAAIQPRPNGHRWCALCGHWWKEDVEPCHMSGCVLVLIPAKDLRRKYPAEAQAQREDSDERRRDD